MSDSFDLSSQNPTFEERMARAETWSELLYDSVPATELRPAFQRAFKDHDSAFPVNAYDVKKGYESNNAEYEKRRYDARMKAQLADAAAVSPQFFECQTCLGTGFRYETRRDAWNFAYKGVARVYDCCGYWTKRAENIQTPHKIER